MRTQDIMYIAEKMGNAACYEQLAEEAAELAAACLKVSRILRAESPTPVTLDAAVAVAIEEIADVRLCSNIILSGCMRKARGIYATSDIVNAKCARWIERLNGMEAAHG